MHNAALAALGLDWVYVPFDVAPEQVAAAVAGIRALGLVGVNVTVPLKELVLPFLDEVDDDAGAIGSVNTIHNRDGRLARLQHGRAGFSARAGRSRRAGGRAAASCCWARAARRARSPSPWPSAAAALSIANRTRARAQELADRINVFYPGAASVAEWGADAATFDLLVNTTSLGMAPQRGRHARAAAGRAAARRLGL